MHSRAHDDLIGEQPKEALTQRFFSFLSSPVLSIRFILRNVSQATAFIGWPNRIDWNSARAQVKVVVDLQQQQVDAQHC